MAALNNSIMTILPHLQEKNMKGEPRRDYVPVAGIANIPTFFAVSGDSSIKTVADRIKHAKARARHLLVRRRGQPAAPGHRDVQVLRRGRSGACALPRRESGALAVASGELNVMSMALSRANPFLGDERVRLIGYCGSERHAQFRDLPTLQEQGVQNYDYSSWVALFLPRQVPADLLAALRKEAQAIVQDRDFRCS